MGNKNAKLALKPKEAQKYSAATGFGVEEIKALHSQFLSLKTGEVSENPTMSFAEFQAALGHRGSQASTFIERIFNLFDENHDGSITFEEFITGLHLLTPNVAPEKKLRFTFNIYDMHRRGKISPSDLTTILSAVLRENDLAMSDEQVSAMVTDTLKAHDVDGDGYINYEEYVQMCVKHPSVLKPLTLNVPDLVAQARAAAAEVTASPSKK